MLEMIFISNITFESSDYKQWESGSFVWTCRCWSLLQCSFFHSRRTAQQKQHNQRVQCYTNPEGFEGSLYSSDFHIMKLHIEVAACDHSYPENLSSWCDIEKNHADLMFSAKRAAFTHSCLWSWRCCLLQVSWGSPSWGRCLTGTCRTPARCRGREERSGSASSPGPRSRPSLWRWWWCHDLLPGRPPSVPEVTQCGLILIN